MITIQKSTSGAYFTITDASGIAKPYMVNEYDFVPNADGSSFSLVSKYKLMTDERYHNQATDIISNVPYTQVTNGDTSSVFADFATLQTYVLTNFFRKAGGSAGAPAWGSITGTLSSQSDLATALLDVVDITYANLVTAIGASTLIKGTQYRVTDFATVHTIPNSSPTLVNTATTEPIIVTALSTNVISNVAYSETYPTDTIWYTVSNSLLSGATKGVITKRVDNYLNIETPYDFRGVRFRRYKLNPTAWSSGTAYNLYDVVLYTDGAIYFCNNLAGVTAGDIPSQTSDNWCLLFPNNSYYLAPTTAAYQVVILGGVSIGHATPSIPVDATNFVDVPTFQDYDSTNTARYWDITIKGNTMGTLPNVVVFRKSTQAAVLKHSFFGYLNSNSTIVADNGNFFNMNIFLGMINTILFSNGSSGMGHWNIRRLSGLIANGQAAYDIEAHAIYFSVIRGVFNNIRVNTMKYCVMSNSTRDLYATGNVSSLKCISSATMRSVHFLMSPANEYNGAANPSDDSTNNVYVNASIDSRTFIGGTGVIDNYYQYQLMQSAILRAAFRKIVFLTPDQPSEKTTVKITNGSPLVVTWQTTLVPFLSDSTYSAIGTATNAHNDQIGALATYGSKHGSDFQVQQKDLIAGVWTVNNTPTYTIDTVDGSGNVTQVTFTPNAGGTESRFIIV